MQDLFGTWVGALEVAGLPPIKPRLTQEVKAESVAAWEACDRNVRAAAARLDMSVAGLRYRLRMAGVLPSPEQRRLPGFRLPRYPVAAEVRWQVWERDDFRCKDCGTRQHLSIDHIVPVAGGATNDISNLQTLCVRCNAGKKDREPRTT